MIKDAKRRGEQSLQAAKLYQFQVEEQESELPLTYTHTTLSEDPDKSRTGAQSSLVGRLKLFPMFKVLIPLQKPKAMESLYSGANSTCFPAKYFMTE